MRAFAIVAVVLAGLSAHESRLAADPPASTVFVPATVDPSGDSGWVDSGVTVTEGEALAIDAHGQALTGPLRYYPGARSGPDGQEAICPDPNAPLQIDCPDNGAPYGALIGRIGDSTFVVGSRFRDDAPATGELLFSVNDNFTTYYDNAGGYAVQIH